MATADGHGQLTGAASLEMLPSRSISSIESAPPTTTDHETEGEGDQLEPAVHVPSQALDFDPDQQLSSFEEDVGFKISAVASMLQFQSAEMKEQNWKQLGKDKDELTSFVEIYTVLFGLVALTLSAKQLPNKPSKDSIKALTTKLWPKLPKSEYDSAQPALTKSCFMSNLHELLHEIHSDVQMSQLHAPASDEQKLDVSNHVPWAVPLDRQHARSMAVAPRSTARLGTTTGEGEPTKSKNKKSKPVEYKTNPDWDLSATNINDYKPTCPVIFFERGNQQRKQIFTIHCQRLDVSVECHASTALIRMHGQWTNRTKDTLDCVFALPTPGTVTSVKVDIGAHRVLMTKLCDKRDAQKLAEENRKNRDQSDIVQPEMANPYATYVPDLFRFPFGNVSPGDTISLTCHYIEQLDYYKKGYIVSLPLYFPPGTIVNSLSWEQVVTVTCTINAFTPNPKTDCWTHHIQQECDESGTVTIRCGACKPLEEGKENQYAGGALSATSPDSSLNKTGRDFELSYSVKSETIAAHCVQEADYDDPDSGSLFILITPPATLSTTFGRAFFFLLDRSGSMVGEPYREATRALNRALDRLRPSDQFNVCTFDHRQVYFQPALVPGNKEMLASCKQWIHSYQPERGGTTMDAPITAALQQLETSDLLPFVVLITDGAVHNEREICEKIKSNTKMRTRFLTLGIGSYCNWFFLRMLATLGRGFSDMVVYKEHIYHKMDHLLRMANTPVLTDIEIGLKGDEIEIYPFPIPDLFIGAPVTIGVRYTSTDEVPDKIAVRGFNPHGDRERIECPVVEGEGIPVHKIFALRQIEIMTSDAWLKQSKKLEDKVVNFSLRMNVPSMFTDIVMFETTRSALEEELRNSKLESHPIIERQKAERYQRYGDSDWNWNYVLSDPDCGEVFAYLFYGWMRLQILAIENTVELVESGCQSFGDVQSTLDNIPILGGGGDLDLDVNCCEGGDCGCDDAGFDDCGDCCGNCTVM